MKRCEICRSDYACSHTARAADGGRPQATQNSWALARRIEITTSAPPTRAEERNPRRGGRTIFDDFREFLEDLRLRRFSLTIGAHGVELQVSRAAISVSLFTLGVAALLCAFSADVITGGMYRWLPDLLLAAGVAGMIAPWRGAGPAGSMVLTGLVLLAGRLHIVDLSLWATLTIAAGGCSLLYRRHVRISGITVKFVY